MQRQATEDIPIGKDLVPPLPPLAAALHNSTLSTHCAACFSLLPTQPFDLLIPPVSQFSQHVPDGTPTLFYCSPRCSSLDSSLHFSSAEGQLLSRLHKKPSSEWPDSSNLRLSLRLLHKFEQERDLRRMSGLENNDNHLPFQETENKEGPDEYFERKEQPNVDMKNWNQDDGAWERIAGLMTNRERLIFQEDKNDYLQETGNGEDPDENVKNSSEKDAFLKRIRKGAKLMAMARRMHGSDVNVNVVSPKEYVVEEMVLCLVLTNAAEVLDKSGCSVGVAVYGTMFSWFNHSCSPNAWYRFLTGPEHADDLRSRISLSTMENGNEILIEGKEAYGPRVIVRSIKAIKEGEGVTIAYTDVFQSKKMRQYMLWMKYQFNCGCKRCSAEPASYVDCALQAIYAVKVDCLEKISDHDLYRDEEIENLTDFIDNVINHYLCFGDPKSCCEKLENLLSHGHFVEQLEPKEAESRQILKLHPFHHLSLNAYATLASMYKVRANDLLALDSGIDGDNFEAFNMHRTSVAYSLLHAGVTHHLFTFESSFIVSVANSWKNAGESLLSFAKCSSWNLFLKLGTFEKITRQFYNCISTITSKVWRSLISEGSYLKAIENPIEFSWLAPPDSFKVADFGAHFPKIGMEKDLSRCEAMECTNQDTTNLILLSIHCLRYGAFLSSICYGLHP
ncbi:unnamed protein product [Fraxinus pennsylvanica]|uniref:SET domain-containing protein n=1 Tax=Fraxinus pennsylvanica TaxID=56036 RepID=A0AAD1ZTA6_9LAMI|nr:unnamed protein product [Fraxinus pennsylvanica]